MTDEADSGGRSLWERVQEAEERAVRDFLGSAGQLPGGDALATDRTPILWAGAFRTGRPPKQPPS